MLLSAHILRNAVEHPYVQQLMKEKLYREIQINPGWPPLKAIWNLTALDCHLCVLPWIARNGDHQSQAFLQEVQEAHRCLSIHWSLLLLEFLGCWYSMSFIGSSSHQQSIRISILIHVVFSNICFTRDTRDRSYTAMSKWLIRLRAGSGKPTTNNHRRSWKRATAISWSRAANRQSESPPMVSWRHLPTPWDIRGRFTNLQFVGKVDDQAQGLCVGEYIWCLLSVFMPSAKTNESQHLGMGNTCFVLCALFRFYCCKWFGNLKGTLNSLILSLLYLITVAMWGMAYDVNFDSMTQQNVKTSKVRSIRRVLKPNEAVFPKLGPTMFWIGYDWCNSWHA